MDDKLQFKISSALKDLVGKDLITSDNIAIFELVKNSYDAYADHVVITFANDKIIIADNGKGMSFADLKDKWLFLGFSAKKVSCCPPCSWFVRCQALSLLML